MKMLLTKRLVLFAFLMSCAISISLAQQLEGNIGISQDGRSGWMDLRSITDFQRGERIRIVVGGTAKKILLRFLPKGADPNSPSGIDGGARQVPDSRAIELVLGSEHKQTVQISVHGGRNPWNLIPLGENNGSATLVSIERLSQNK